MIVKMFIIYDMKSDAYSVPECFRTRLEAMREWASRLSKPQTPRDERVAAHPADYVMYDVGEFDILTGKVVVYDKHSLGSALDLVGNRSAGSEKAATVETAAAKLRGSRGIDPKLAQLDLEDSIRALQQ